MPAKAVQPPVGGWNARDAFDEMAEEDAIELVNWISRGSVVESRKGCRQWATGLGGPVETLLSFRDPDGDQLLACANGKIFDVTVGTDPLYDEADVPYDDAGYFYDGPDPDALNAELKTGLTRNRWQQEHHTGRLIITNGADTPLVYNGTAFANADFTGSGNDPSGNALVPANLYGCRLFKGRMFYWEERAQFLWYAKAASFQGELTAFNLAREVSRGGYLVQMLTWTLDSGEGVDDLAVFVFSTGEVLVYQGDDPGDVNAWGKVGKFAIGEPLGVRAAEQVGGTNILLTKDGYVDLAAALQDGRYSENSAYSHKIIRAAQEAASRYANRFGWECLLYPAGNLFIVNVPTGDESSIQHVRDTSSGAWCKFESWNAATFAVHRDDLFFGGFDGNVYHADYGTDDDDEPITATAIPAFTSLGSRITKKQLTAVQHITNFQHPSYMALDGYGDYKIAYGTEATLTVPPAETDYTAELLSGTTGGWRNVWAQGYAVTVRLRVKSAKQQTLWYQTNYLFQQLGVI